MDAEKAYRLYVSQQLPGGPVSEAEMVFDAFMAGYKKGAQDQYVSMTKKESPANDSTRTT